MSIEFKGDAYASGPLSTGMYSDGTPMVKTDQWEEIVANADTMVLKASSLQEFVVGMFMYDALIAASAVPMKLVLPYVPGARQDRSNPTGDVLFTLRSVANMLNERTFSEVVIADPHSPKTLELINNVREYPLASIYGKLWKGYGGVIAPDKGAKARAVAAQAIIGGELRYGGKTRDVATGRLTGFEVEDLTPGKHYIVVDDICDGGGTFNGLGEKIKEQGAFADLFVTHGIFSKGTREMKEFYKNIYTTDTRQLNTDRRTQVLKVNIVAEMENY